MNQSNLSAIIQKYIAGFLGFNDSEHKEYEKWQYFKQFQDRWDMDAPDFNDMLRKTLDGCDDFVTCGRTKSLAGLATLAAVNEETCEQVRDYLQTLLYSEDHGSIAARQSRIETFVEQINALLDIHFNGKQNMKQTFGTAHFLVCALNPANNYLFRSMDARKFSQYMDIPESIGAGKSFHLERYYLMCDWITQQVHANPALLKLHKDRMDESYCQNDEEHILTFDIITCAASYDLLEDLPVSKSKSKSGNHSAVHTTPQETMELNQMIEEDRTKAEDVRLKLQEAESRRSGISLPRIEGETVAHRSFGTGTIIQQDGSHIQVRFESAEKQFSLPTVFSKKFMTIDNPEYTRVFDEMGSLDAEIQKYKDEIQKIENRIARNS